VAREDELAGPVGSGVACLWVGIMGRFVLVNPDRPVVPVSLYFSVMVEGSTGTVDCCL
jgi:hypothetical protein